MKLLLKCPSFDEFHYEIVVLPVTELVVDLGDVLVAQGGEQVGFALERRNRALLFLDIGEIVDHLGQGASAMIEPQILGEVNGLLPTAAKLFDNLVPASDKLSIGRLHRYHLGRTLAGEACTGHAFDWEQTRTAPGSAAFYIG